MKLLTPWSNPADPNIHFPLKLFEQLLVKLGWNKPNDWLNHWNEFGGISLATSAWPAKTKSDWVWGLGLPFLTDVEATLNSINNRVLFGISGLPGIGKSSFGKWIEAAAIELNWPLSVISLDDYYLPAEEMKKAIFGNPWNVARGFPGSHSVNLLEETVGNWMNNGHLISPKFDKALRNGMGDRCGWSNCYPKLLIIEGWFLGCPTLKNTTKKINPKNILDLKLTEQERDYQEYIQVALKDYERIWTRFSHIWHLKATNMQYSQNWKSEQEVKMLHERGAAMQGADLEAFNRMIRAAIPTESFESIKSDFVAEISKNRRITWVGEGQPK